MLRASLLILLIIISCQNQKLHGQAKVSIDHFDETDQPLSEALKSSGLVGRWIVRSVAKEGDFSPAQIGQELDDIITISPDQENERRWIVG